jgi:hypothetical protein
VSLHHAGIKYAVCNVVTTFPVALYAPLTAHSCGFLKLDYKKRYFNMLRFQRLLDIIAYERLFTQAFTFFLFFFCCLRWKQVLSISK